jgi:hypothetical protein
MSEVLYDAEIAPALLALAEKCKAAGMPFLAVVEYEPGSRGRTAAGIGENDLDMQIINIAAQRPNIDQITMSVAQIVQERGMPHTCISLERMGIDPDPRKRNVA